MFVLSLPATAVWADPASAEAAKTQADMNPYTEMISGTDVSFDMVPIPGGRFLMGSSDGEDGRNDDEGPQHPVEVEPFWMGKHEVTWEEYDIWNFSLDVQRRRIEKKQPTPNDNLSDAVTRPTKPYTDMTFGSGHDGYPAISMTQLGAKMYCKWLSAKTGHYYRLPTEAEWEYACRAGTTTVYSFGDDPDQLGEYAWYYDNAGDEREANYHKIGLKKPNPWGLHDMHGNVGEWVLDQFLPNFYGRSSADTPAVFPLAVPTKEYPRVVRGGSWDDDPEQLRSAARAASEDEWKIQDPQIPKSVWYHTDALHVGFRIIRPLRVPTEEERKRFQLDPIVPDHARTESALAN